MNHVFHNRRDIVEHLMSAHEWDVTKMGVGGTTSPDSLGWHDSTGGYYPRDSELLVIHRELTNLE